MSDIEYNTAPRQAREASTAKATLIADRRDLLRLYVFAIGIPVSVFFMAAGGLGLATSAGLMSMAAILISGRRLLPAYRPGWPFLVLSMALAYTALSLFWSPYDKPDQGFKLLLLTPLYLALPLFARRVREVSGTPVKAIILGTTIAGLIFMSFEALTGGAITQSYKLGVEGYEPGQVLDNAVMKTLSRGAFALLLISGPVAILCLTVLKRERWLMIGLISIMMVFVASGFDVEANQLAIVVGALLAALAWRWPRGTLIGILFTGAAIILSAPLLLPVFSGLPDTGVGSHLPFSWEWRLETWALTSDYIAERPFFGYGLDASRILDEVTTMRGYEVSLLPLHPHNAALHIWLETGFVGAALWAGVLVMTALRINTLAISGQRAAGLAFVMAAWMVSVLVGFGLWQEWHHGALSIALAVALFIPQKIQS